METLKSLRRGQKNRKKKQMDNVVSGSFAQFSPEEAIKYIDSHLELIENTKAEDRQAWFDKMHERGKTTGIWFWKKTEPWDADELENIWIHGFGDEWYWAPKRKHWDKWDETILAFNRLKSFCQVAIESGNTVVHLSKEDANFAFRWQL